MRTTTILTIDPDDWFDVQRRESEPGVLISVGGLILCLPTEKAAAALLDAAQQACAMLIEHEPVPA